MRVPLRKIILPIILLIILIGLFIVNVVYIDSFFDVSYNRFEYENQEKTFFSINEQTNHLIIGDFGKGADILDIHTMNVITTISALNARYISYHDTENLIAISSLTETIRVYDQHTYAIMNELDASGLTFTAMTWIPNQDKLLYHANGLVQTWDINTNEIANISVDHPHYIIKLFEWDNSGSTLLSADTNGGINVWDTDFELLNSITGSDVIFQSITWLNETNVLLVYENGLVLNQNVFNEKYTKLFEFNRTDTMIRVSKDKSKIVVTVDDQMHEVYDITSKLLLSSFGYEEVKDEGYSTIRDLLWNPITDSIISLYNDFIVVWDGDFTLSNIDKIDKSQTVNRYLTIAILLDVLWLVLILRKKWLKFFRK